MSRGIWAVMDPLDYAPFVGDDVDARLVIRARTGIEDGVPLLEDRFDHPRRIPALEKLKP